MEGFDSGARDAMWYLDGCDYIGKVETLQEDFDKICKIIGVGQTTLANLNSSPHGDYRDFYDEESKDFISKVHNKTIERFGYVF